MRALAVDDNEESLQNIKQVLNSVDGISEAEVFATEDEALRWAQASRVDIAFVDVTKPDGSGLLLAVRIREMYPQCLIVFVSATQSLAMEALHFHVLDYLVKPVTGEKVQEIINFVRKVYREDKALRVKCFGIFEVFDRNGKPLKFKYRKSKEMLAYLIYQNGAVCDTKTLTAVLYKERREMPQTGSLIRNIFSDLTAALKAAGAEEALIRRPGIAAIIPDKIDCDFYDLENGVIDISVYHGEFMTQYSWAAPVTAELDARKYNKQ